MNPPSVDVKDMLDSTSAGADLGTYGTDLFVGIEPMLPDACVSILDTGGFAPEALAERIEHPTVQIRVRGAKGGYTTAYAKAKAINDSLHKRTDETWNSSRYIAIYAMSDPLFVGWDESDRPTFTLNFRIDRTAP